jgi:histidinol-phosphatase
VDDLELALALADIADAITTPAYIDAAIDLDVVEKPDGSQVTRFDRAVESAVREALAEHRPDDGVLGEEFGATGSTARRWVIDPIDGTSAFIARGREWSTLISLEIDQVPVVGVVSMPSLLTRWWGTAGSGAFRRRASAEAPESITVGAVTSPLRWAYVVGPGELTPPRRALVSDLEAVAPSVPFERWTTYPSLMVAQGDLDCAVQTGYRWDLAAHVAVVRAAGGVAHLEPWLDGQESVRFTSVG